MKALIETIVTPLIDYPADLHVEVEETDAKIRYHITVNENDVGKVIGKNGRIAKAVRTVVHAAHSNTDKKVYVDIM
ncbi:KH domain-containing protein [Halalkalibacillus halophilus]|uniref:KH domain-containing protein n=1 Tax=Halalkalibacillus halophilus TaxID=392827 RepID=UPI0004079231|nr:KH domain-containing protein [Halalkalibacillus halophilus]